MKRICWTFAVMLIMGYVPVAMAADEFPDPCTKEKITEKKCEVDFASLTPGEDGEQAQVQRFAESGLDLKDLARPPVEDELKDENKNYLEPNHPSPQPDVPMSNWRKYTGVPNVDKVGDIDEETRKDQYGEYVFELKTLLPVTAPELIETTYVRTPQALFPKVDPWIRPPGTNMLPLVNRELLNDKGDEIPNTLPSTKTKPYNLHDGYPKATRINPLSPIEDLRYILEEVYELLTGRAYKSFYEALSEDTAAQAITQSLQALSKQNITDNASKIRHLLRWAIDTIEGNDGPGSKVPDDRAYKGFALLNHSGHKRVRCVEPVYDAAGKIVGGNVDVHQIWYGGRIQSDTMFVDFGWQYLSGEDTFLSAEENGYGGRRCDNGKNPPPIPPNKPWTVTYTIDALHASRDDFAPTGMFFDCPSQLQAGASGYDCPAPDVELAPGDIKWKKKELPTGFAMDQSFFPMADGTRTIFKIKMAPPMYYKLTYTWGWRQHPPRAQAMENAHQGVPPQSPKPIVKHEFDTFGDDPSAAIAKISDLAPAKRMWTAFQWIDDAVSRIDQLPEDEYGDSKIVKRGWRVKLLGHLLDVRNAYLDWLDRTKLPSGFTPDPGGDLTMLFINNTMYGEFTEGGLKFHDWRKRITSDDDKTSGPTKVYNNNKLKLTLINADYFSHGYVNVDFGGLRGWENQFKPSIKTGGAGSFFTFGRFYHRPNVVPGSLSVAGATKDSEGTVTPGVHRIMIEYNFDPSRRLRFYQFDPLHHDVAIYSVH